MPNNHSPWNELANPPIGNPTRSTVVNKLNKDCKKKDCLAWLPIQSTRALKREEFESAMDIMEKIQNKEIVLWLSYYFGTSII
jgi:hypothetical protein